LKYDYDNLKATFDHTNNSADKEIKILKDKNEEFRNEVKFNHNTIKMKESWKKTKITY